MSLADIFKKIVGSISSYYIYISIKNIYLNSNVVVFFSLPSPL